MRIRLNANWLENYDFANAGDRHPAGDDAGFRKLLRDHRSRTAIVYPLRCPLLVTQLAECGLLAIGVDENAERRQLASPVLSSQEVFITGGLEIVTCEVDLVVLDLVGARAAAAERLVGLAEERVCSGGLLVTISASGLSPALCAHWHSIGRMMFRTARLTDDLTAEFEEELVTIANVLR